MHADVKDGIMLSMFPTLKSFDPGKPDGFFVSANQDKTNDSQKKQNK